MKCTKSPAEYIFLAFPVSGGENRQPAHMTNVAMDAPGNDGVDLTILASERNITRPVSQHAVGSCAG